MPAQNGNSVMKMLATGLVVIGVVLNRWDVNLSGQLITVSYLPAAVPAAASLPTLLGQRYPSTSSMGRNRPPPLDALPAGRAVCAGVGLSRDGRA